MFLVWLLPLVLQADLDDDGKPETISLGKDGMLTAGLGAKLVHYDEANGPEHTKVEVISLGGKRKGIYLITEQTEGEDPPDRHQVFLVGKDSLTLVFNELLSTHHITWSKHGTGRHVESGWDACLRMQELRKKPVMRAKKQIITLKLDVKTAKLVGTRRTSSEVVQCDQLAACPFVYELVGETQVFMGEILRNIRHTPSLQSLPIGKGGHTAIRLTEEKPEITFLDEIFIEVDGKRVKPKACETVTLPYCEADGMYTLMMQGDALDLEFDAPHGQRHLWARGYYNPLP